MNAVELLILAQRDPVQALRELHGLLSEAVIVATVDFDPMAASTMARQASVTLGLVAEALREHALSAPFHRRRQRMVAKAQARPAEDAVPEEEESEAWKAVCSAPEERV